MGSVVLRENVRRILEEDSRKAQVEEQSMNQLMEQMKHIHQLVMKQDGSENILKLVQAEELIMMIMARNVMDQMGG